MMQTRHFAASAVLATALTLLSSMASAGSLSAPVKLEIESALTALKTSGCQFNRNGAWYSSDEAHAHLTKKLKYLTDKDLVHSAEEFVALGASTSSASGKPYQVRCGKAPAVESRAWMQEQLTVLRAVKRRSGEAAS